MIIEGKFNKGGRNNKPSCTRPAKPPKGMARKSNKKPIILTIKDIDKLQIYYSDREIANIFWFS